MDKYQRILSTVNSNTGFLRLIEEGVKPQEIKESIICLLEPYFQNREVLEQHAIDHLVPDAVNFTQLREDRAFFERFSRCLATYHSAKSKDETGCLEACATWLDEICSSESKFWSVAHLEVDKSVLEPEDALHECLKNIGEIIEGLMKPYLKVLLAQTRIARGQQRPIHEIDYMTLGEIVQELTASTDYPDLFVPPPWNVSLSQWRNIAYHHSAKIQGTAIVCWWGRSGSTKRIELTRGEMVLVVSTLFKTYRTLKLAHTLFVVDNSTAISAMPITCEREPREEAELLNFTAGLASQGFQIEELKKDANEARAVLRDVSDLDIGKRRAHASQFLFPLWRATRSKKLVIEYRRKDNKPDLLMTATAEICERIYAGQEDPLILAERTELLDLKTGKIISRWRSK